MRFPRCVPLYVVLALSTLHLLAQSPDGNINGLVSDPSSAAVVGAEIVAVNDATGVQYSTRTNHEGVYVLPSLPPGPYRLQVSKPGFKTIIKPDIILNVQDALSINFTLPIGATYEVMTVQGGAPLVNTENASVSTVVDRQFAENLPMNGRSFQTLIELTPGVVLTASNGEDSGQFSINGQRASANYWTVDGVSANVAASSSSGSGNGVAGALGSFGVLGGTNSLVSVDALQEFRIQTSTYAPEFGRTPGGQISIATRSGTNQFHGTAFDYLRNDVLDANDWFNGFDQNPPLPKAKERQNDFGGTVGGPLVKDRTFFFLSYEGLRLRLPQTTLTTVPDAAARMNSTPALQPYLNAFPVPNGPDTLSAGLAQFNESYSNPATLDAVSLRVDHKLKHWLTIFGRYNDSPSELDQRGLNGLALSIESHSRVALQTATAGLVWMISPKAANDFRFNYSRTNASSYYSQDGFGGAVPLPSLPFASGFSQGNGSFQLDIGSLTSGSLLIGANAHNLQRQLNIIDILSLQEGTHSLKFGVDFRRLSPLQALPQYREGAFFADIPSTEQGNSFFGYIFSAVPTTLLFRNLGAFAQDTWRPTPALTLTYGLRWELDLPPAALNGPPLPAVTGYSLTDFSQLAVAPRGTPPFATTYGNLAPRLGLAYQIRQDPRWPLVARGGIGLFYDLATSESGNLTSYGFPPYQANNFNLSGAFPYTAQQIAPVPIPPTGMISSLYAFNPHLKLPYAVEWNFALEQGLGDQQTLSVSYLGAVGHRLLQTSDIIFPPSNPNMMGLLVDNTAKSNYEALQIQFKRRLSGGLQVLSSYTWSHSLDDGSAGSAALTSNAGVPGSNPRVNWGPSDFDVRSAFSAGVSYQVPTTGGPALARTILRDWSTENFFSARSAQPVDVADANFANTPLRGDILAEIRPDVIPGRPLYLFGSQYPGQKAFNPAAFQDPPTSNGIPTRQGNLGRNALLGFGAWQWDFAVHRNFPIKESVKLQFRAEMLNVLNHPNFAPPSSSFALPGFGISNEMLGQYLGGGNVGGGGLSPLYQLGGPRSIQFALKLFF